MKNGNWPSGVKAASWSHSTRTDPVKLSTMTPRRLSKLNRGLFTHRVNANARKILRSSH